MSANRGGSLEPAKKSKNRLLRSLAFWALCVGAGALAGYGNSTPHDSLRGLWVGTTLGVAIGALYFIAPTPETPVAYWMGTGCFSPGSLNLVRR